MATIKKRVRVAALADVHCGRVALHSIPALDDFARAKLKAFVPKAAAPQVTAPSTPTLPPLASAVGEWRAQA